MGECVVALKALSVLVLKSNRGRGLEIVEMMKLLNNINFYILFIT